MYEVYVYTQEEKYIEEREELDINIVISNPYRTRVLSKDYFQ